MGVITKAHASGLGSVIGSGENLYEVLSGIQADLANLKAALDAHTHTGTNPCAVTSGKTSGALTTSVHPTK